MRRIAGLLLFCLGGPSYAAPTDPPVYLRCTLVATKEKPANLLDFTLNESNGTVTVKGFDSTSSTSQAMFGPDYINWTDDLGYRSTLARSINRVDLSYTETVDIMGLATTQKGSCVVVPPPKRKV